MSFEVTGSDRAECSMMALATLAGFLGHADVNLADLTIIYAPDLSIVHDGSSSVVQWRAEVEYVGEMRKPLQFGEATAP